MILPTLLIAGAALAAGGAVWQRRTNAAAAGLTPPGRMVKVDGRDTHLLVTGVGGPVVVLDSGLSGCHLEWADVIAGIAEHTTVVHIDRPGAGFSAPADMPMSAKAVADAHFKALDAAGIDGPFILIGHSLGGLHIRAMAHTQPHKVAGMIYLDVTHEKLPELMPSAIKAFKVTPPIVKGLAGLGELGLLRVLNAMGAGYADVVVKSSGSSWPTSLDKARTDLILGRPDVLRAIAREYESIEGSLAEMVELRAAGALPDVPTVVLSAGRHPKKQAETMRRYVQVAHGDLAAQSTQSRHETIEDSGHLIPLDRPDRVVAAVTEVLDAVAAAA